MFEIMTTCKDCLHCDVCVIRAMPSAFENTKWEKEPCDHFKDQSLCIELPCKVGDVVYCISSGSVKEKNIVSIAMLISNSLRSLTFHGKNERGAITSFETIDLGKTVFLSREEAERALKGEK